MITIQETNNPVLIAELNEEVQVLHHKLNPEVFKEYNKPDVISFFNDLFNEKNVKAFIAFQNGDPAGYSLVFFNHHPGNAFQYAYQSIHIDQLGVKNKFQKMGIGSLLLKHVYDLALEMKIPQIDLNHWSNNNIARSFFKKNGFECYNEKMFKKVEF